MVDISDKTIWQQAAGDTDRNYAEWCLKFHPCFIWVQSVAKKNLI